MKIFVNLGIDKIFGAIFASIYGKNGDFCAHSGFFGRFFSPDGGIFHGEKAGTDTGKQSAQWAGIDGETMGTSWQALTGDCLTGETGRKQARAGRAGGTGKRQHNRALCGLLRLKSNITSKQPYPSHPTS